MAKSKKIKQIVENTVKDLDKYLYVQKIMEEFKEEYPQNMRVYNGRINLPLGYVHSVYTMINDINRVINEEDTSGEEVSNK